MKDGKEIPSEKQKQPEKEKEKSKDKDEPTYEHLLKLTQQQKQCIEQQALVCQTQDSRIIQLQAHIQQLEEERQLQQDQQVVTTATQQQIMSQALPTMPSVGDLSLSTIDADVITSILGSDETEQQIASTSSGRRKGKFIQRLLRPEHMRFLPSAPVKKEPLEVEQEEIIALEDVPKILEEKSIVEVVRMPETTEAAPNIIMVPKKVEKKKAVMLVPTATESRSSKRTNPGAPIPKEHQDPKFEYCKNCACRYKDKYELNKHIKYRCRKTEFDYFCDKCGKGFHREVGVREHYYHEHLQKELYRCVYCGKKFFFKSYRSKHKTACPNLDGPILYEPEIKRDPELEKSFKKRERVDVEIPEDVLEYAAQIEAEEEEELQRCIEEEKEKGKGKEKEKEKGKKGKEAKEPQREPEPEPEPEPMETEKEDDGKSGTEEKEDDGNSGKVPEKKLVSYDDDDNGNGDE